jgi:hypothetical protein
MNRLICALIVLAAVPATALAQPPDWTLKLQLGKPVFLTTQSGERGEGATGQITPDAIVVSTPAGIRTVEYRELRRAQKRDALWTGAAVGAGIGAAMGIAIVANGECRPQSCNAEETGFVFGSAIYGALIGWGLDALVKGQTTLFETDASTTVGILPRRGGVSAGLAVRW